MARTKQTGKSTRDDTSIVPPQSKKRASSSSAPPPPSISPKFKTCRFLIRRFTNFDFVFAYLPNVLNWIDQSNLRSVFTIKANAYPDLIREFYSNLTSDCSTSFAIDSRVKGIPIHLDSQVLGTILGIPFAGSTFYTTQSEWPDTLPLFDPATAINLILNTQNANALTLVKTKKLSVDMKFLHKMISTILIPRSGKFDKVTHMEIVVLWHLVSGTPINIPYLLLKHMDDSATKGKILPYGGILTKVFKFFRLSFQNEAIQRMKDSSAVNATTISRMGYIMKEGVWIHDPKKAGKELDEEDEDNTDDDLDRFIVEPIGASSSAAPPTAGASSSAAPPSAYDLLLRLHSRMDSFESSMASQFSLFESRFDAIESQFTELRSMIQSSDVDDDDAGT